MEEKIRKVMSSKTIQQSIITVVSTFGSAGLGAIFYLLLARLIGSHEYGLFSVCLTITVLGLTIGDVGMGQGLVKFIAKYRESNKYFPFVKIALLTKILMGSLIFLALLLGAKPIANILFRQEELTKLLPLVGLSILALLLFSLTIAAFQGLQKFWQWGGLQVGANLIRLVLMGIIFLIVRLDAIWALILFASAPLIGFILSWKWLSLDILKSKIENIHINSFWHFNKWTAAFAITSSIASRLDTLLSARYLSLSETGVYALANTMVAFLPQLSSAIGAVTAPKFAGFVVKEDSEKYLGKAMFLSLGTTLAVALMMIPASIFVIWFTGKDFNGAMIPFLILLLALSIFTSLNPIRDSILYYHQKPDFFFWAGIFQAVTVILFGMMLIPQFGVIGTALSVLVSHVFMAGLCIWKYSRLANKI